MIVDKPYEEIISKYNLDELYGVKKRIDAVAHADRYELVIKEIEKRKNGIGPAEVLKEDTKSALEKQQNFGQNDRRIQDMPSFIISCIFGLAFICTLYYKTEIEQKYGSFAQMSTFLLMVFNLYFARKAWGKHWK